MREIKFRGKRVDNGEWVYGYYGARANPYKEDGLPITHFIVDLTPFGDAVYKETVGQFTGLLDKNGKEIYEGDILLCEDRIVKVEWNEPNGTWDSTFLMYTNEPLCSNGINVVEWKYRAINVGNIHDNLEVLK